MAILLIIVPPILILFWPRYPKFPEHFAARLVCSVLVVEVILLTFTWWVSQSSSGGEPVAPIVADKTAEGLGMILFTGIAAVFSCFPAVMLCLIRKLESSDKADKILTTQLNPRDKSDGLS